MASLLFVVLLSFTIVSSVEGSVPLNCSAINDPSVRNMTFRLPVTSIPASEMTVMCHKFLLPNDTDYDIIALVPVIDNTQFVEYVNFGASVSNPNGFTLSDTYVCGQAEGGGQTLLELWVSGAPGNCLGDQYGYRIGPNGFQYAELRITWTNPQLQTGQTDSSGTIIYYTPNLRPNRGAMFAPGQYYLAIPPGQRSVTAVGSCVPACSQQFPGPIYLTGGFLYMQLLGISGNVTLYRNGTLVQTVYSVSHYDYDNPVFFQFRTQIEMMPGDEIRVTCVYQSTSSNTTTYWGKLITTQEMCFGFLNYYPMINGLLFCGQWKTTIDVCSNLKDILFQKCESRRSFSSVKILPVDHVPRTVVQAPVAES